MSENTNRNERPLIFKDLTHKIIGAALEVYKILGYGFINEVYEKALLKELELRGGGIKCTFCGYRILKKIRPPVVKRISTK